MIPESLNASRRPFPRRFVPASKWEHRSPYDAPFGFLSDHMEVMYDLDYEAAALCRDLGLNFVRAGTAGTHPCVIAMLAELIEERQSGADLPLCAADCCPAPRRGGA